MCSPQLWRKFKEVWDGTSGLSSFSEKTRSSNHLQMKLQRQHFSPHLFNDPECWPGVSNSRPPAWQPGAQPSGSLVPRLKFATFVACSSGLFQGCSKLHRSNHVLTRVAPSKKPEAVLRLLFLNWLSEPPQMSLCLIFFYLILESLKSRVNVVRYENIWKSMIRSKLQVSEQMKS